MLSALAGRPDRRWGTRVPMPAGKAEFAAERRIHHRSRAIRRGRGAADIAMRMEQRLSSTQGARRAGHMGNVGLIAELFQIAA